MAMLDAIDLYPDGPSVADRRFALISELDSIAVAIQHGELAPARHLGDGAPAVNPVQCYDIAIRRFIDGIDAHAQRGRKKVGPPEHIGLSGTQGRISEKRAIPSSLPPGIVCANGSVASAT